MDAPPLNTGTSANVSADKMTIKDMALEILSFMDTGATAQTILAHINRRYPGTNIKRESLSPQLSRLRELGKVELRGKTWFVAGHPWATATNTVELNRLFLPRPASRTEPTDDEPLGDASKLVIVGGDPPPDDGSPLTRIHIGSPRDRS